jgi:hypothetical protein
VQWGSKRIQTDGIIALLQIEQPQRHEEGCNEGFQFVAKIRGDAMKLLTKGRSFLSMWGSAMGQCNGAVQWGSKSSRTDGIIALLQIEQPQRHEEGCNEGFQLWQG